MDLTDSDEAILDVLQEGRATPAFFVEETGYSRQQIYTRLRILEASGAIEQIYEPSSLWELNEDPRE
jgi:DNA-binding Lrp family transcriptional regulator